MRHRSQGPETRKRPLEAIAADQRQSRASSREDTAAPAQATSRLHFRSRPPWCGASRHASSKFCRISSAVGPDAACVSQVRLPVTRSRLMSR